MRIDKMRKRAGDILNYPEQWGGRKKIAQLFLALLDVYEAECSGEHRYHCQTCVRHEKARRTVARILEEM